MSEAYRVLRARGLIISSFLSPHGNNPRQRLFIEADSEPRWTKYPPKEWFSPPPELVGRELGRAGFAEIRVRVVPTHVKFVGRAAIKSLRRWGVRPAFAKMYERKLNEDGLESPDWILVEARKAASSRSSSNRRRRTKVGLYQRAPKFEPSGDESFLFCEHQPTHTQNSQDDGSNHENTRLQTFHGYAPSYPYEQLSLCLAIQWSW
jgi:hypothetical protein